MTRLPTESRAVVGVDDPPYDLNLICAKPGCDQPSTDPHHLWRRSELIGAHWWVHIDDYLLGNVVGLCQLHHHAVTVNSAWITWNEGSFMWADMTSPSMALSFQPPVRQASDEESLPISPGKNGEQPSDPIHTYDGSCPTCHRPLPHPKTEPEGKRPRRTWSITVPVDERENGADNLSVLLEGGRKAMAKAGLPYGSEDSANYFVLSTMLSLFVINADAILSDA